MTERDVIVGVPASPGIVVGPAYIYFTEDFYVVPRTIEPGEVEGELARLEAAIEATRFDLEALRRRAIEEIGESSVGDIFDAHIHMLNDVTHFGRIRERVRTELRNVAFILADETAKLRERFRQVNDEYLSDRFLDIADVCKRVLRQLQPEERGGLQQLAEPVIIVAHNLTPSDTMQLERDHVLGIVTVTGGPTSHTAILAKALEIPAIVGAKSPLYRVRSGDTLVVDGFRGEVTINPDAATIAQVAERQAHVIEFEHELEQLRDLQPITTDGVEVALHANLDLPEELPALELHGAMGVGLYRTEYLFLNRRELPSEEEQYAAYREVVEQFPDQEVTIRTLDVGGDRILSDGFDYQEVNPVMGCRAIRFSLAHPDIFRAQLRAICRAGTHGNIRIMFPMVSGVEELRRATGFLRDVQAELEAEGAVHAPSPPVGIMIELPSAVFTTGLLARECEFLSVGTNDLIQYTLGVDRVNELVADLYEPAHPGIVRSLHYLFRAAEDQHTPVSLCGDLAGHPGFTLLLLGLGLRVFSMVPTEIPEIKRIIRSVSLSDAQAVAAEALEATTATEIRDLVKRNMSDLLPKADFEWEHWFTKE